MSELKFATENEALQYFANLIGKSIKIAQEDETKIEDRKFHINIKTENDAFVDDPNAEVARILSELIGKIKSGKQEGTLRDINGNYVGSFGYTKS